MNISVVIPMYNSKDTIKRAIDSVLNQTYTDTIEIIIVNDGSNDGSEKIVEDLIHGNKTNRIIKLINKENGGVSSARNIGIRESTGEYIAFLDSDDMWHPQKLEIVLNIVKIFYIKFLGHGYTLKNNFEEKFKIKYPVKIPFIKLLLKNFAVTPSILIKKDICEYFDESMTHTEDHELWVRIALKNDVYYLDLPLTVLGRQIMSSGGLSSNKWAMRKGELKMYKNVVGYKNILILIFPFLVIYSLTKHLIRPIKDFLCKKLSKGITSTS